MLLHQSLTLRGGYETTLSELRLSIAIPVKDEDRLLGYENTAFIKYCNKVNKIKINIKSYDLQWRSRFII